jgi:putative redox protein
MQITLDRIHDAIHFEARNPAGDVVEIGTSASIGGLGRGAGPMQLLLMGVAGCSAIDVLSILAKMQQPVDDFRMVVDGERPKDTHPAPWEKIHLHFVVNGAVQPERVERAIFLSLTKYCSVSANLRPTSDITWSYEVNGERFEPELTGDS